MAGILKIKDSNVHSLTSDGNDKNGLGKLTRQTGRTNLRVVANRNHSPIIKSHFTDDFEVFEDTTPSKENEQQSSVSDNNMIHELERKMEIKTKEEQIRQDSAECVDRFMKTRKLESDIGSVYDDAVSVSVYNDDEEYDRCSQASSTFTVIRSEFSQFHVNNDDRFKDADTSSKYAQQKSEKERRMEELVSCDEYFRDIFKFMYDRQTKVRASSRYMSKQGEITSEMRSILFDWFHDVAFEFGLTQETLHLAVALVDRVLSRFFVEKHRLQLVGATALMIAAKYEEIYPPELREFAQVTDNTFRADQILSMERYLLIQLDFVVSTPTTSWFASCFAKRAQIKGNALHALNYLVDLSLIDYEYLRFRPSHIAAAALCFANVMVGESAWPEKLEQDTGMTISGFAIILPFLHKSFVESPTSGFPSIFGKYSTNEFGSVALLPPPERKYVIATSEMQTLCPNMFK